MDKPIAWYDPSNGMVSTDQDCPLFTPLGQVWGLYLKEEAKDEPVAWRAWVSKFPQGTGSDWVYVTKPIMKDSVHNQPLYTTPPQRKPLTGKMLLRAAQASLSPEQYDHFEAMSKHQPDIYDRLAYSIGVQDE
jgi:hypothetical protein